MASVVPAERVSNNSCFILLLLYNNFKQKYKYILNGGGFILSLDYAVSQLFCLFDPSYQRAAVSHEKLSLHKIDVQSPAPPDHSKCPWIKTVNGQASTLHVDKS